MKKLTILATLVAGLYACKPNPQELLQKKWKPVEVKGKAIDKDKKTILLKEGNGMEFLPGGVFVSFAESGPNDTGTYRLEADARTLSVLSSQKHQTIFNVEELKWNRLIIENDGVILILQPGH